VDVRKTFYILAVIAVLAALGSTGMSFLSKKPDADLSVQTVTVKRKDIGSSILATGTVKPVIGAEVKVGARISGRVEHLYANIGDRVEKGQVIAEIEKKDLEAQVAQAEANVRAAEAGVDISKSSLWPVLSAETDYGATDNQYPPRNQNTFAGLKVTMSLFSGQNNYGKQQSKAVKEAAQSALAFSKVQMSYATITAPIAGVIASVGTQEGETVAAGLNAPTFVTIIDLSRLQVDTFVDETDIGRVKIGQKAVFTVDTYPDKEFTGTVKAIYPKAIIQENVVNFDVVIGVDATDGELLRPDMTASVMIYQEARKGVLVISRSAIRKDDEGKFVMVKGDDGTLSRKAIKTGQSSGSDIEVVSGLKEGDTVAIKKEL
jgi:multidrug efflux pump subunit AcrA (membrane-fusion protein)